MRDSHCPRESKHGSISCLRASWPLLTPQQLASQHASFTGWLAVGSSCSEDTPAGHHPSLASLKNTLHTQCRLLVKAELIDFFPEINKCIVVISWY